MGGSGCGQNGTCCGVLNCGPHMLLSYTCEYEDENVLGDADAKRR
jgi:hypothetical protein